MTLHEGGMETPDVQLVARAQSGDPAALEALLGQLAPAVHRFGLRMCRHADDADDVLQDTLLEIARRLPQFEGRSSLSTWAFTIARTACSRRRRGLKNQPFVAEDAAAEAALDAPSPEDVAVAQDLSARLSAALDTLPEEAREVLLLRDVEGLTAPEAAEAIGIEVGALKSRLHRARAALRAALAPWLEDPRPPTPKPEGCPDVVAALSRKLEGDLLAADCEQMEAHVAGCPSCTAACESLRAVLATCRARGGDRPVPPKIQMQVRSAVRALLEERAGGREG